MIAYFDTSAVIPLIVGEPSSAMCMRLWNEAARTVSVRLMYAEARAALAQAQRMARLSQQELARAVGQLDMLTGQMSFIEVTDRLVGAAGALAQTYQLRGYDAIHLAAAQTIADSDAVFISGDRRLIDAAAREGLATALAQ